MGEETMEVSSPEEHRKFRFEELKQIKDAEISARVPKASVIGICENSLENGECSVSEVLRLWAEKLLKAYGAARPSKNDWLILMGFFERIFQRKILPMEAELNVNLDSWSSAYIEFHKQIQAVKDFCFTELSAIVRFMLLTVKAYFDFAKRGASLDRKDVLKYTLSVLLPLLELLSKRVDGSGIVGKAELFSLLTIIRSICELYTYVNDPFVGIKTMVAIWNCLVKLVVYCQGNIRSLKINTEVEAVEHEKVSNWARTPVELLLTEVNKHISVIYKEATLNQPIDQVEKYLRVTSFFLKLLLQVASDFQHAEFPASTEFFENLCQATCVPQYVADANIYVFVEKYILSGFGDILIVLYKNHDLQQMLLRCVEKCEWDWWDVVKLYLHVIVNDQDSQFIDCSADFFIQLFERILHGTSLFVCVDRFDMVIDSYAALTLLSSTFELRSYLKQMVLSLDKCLAQASVDVLVVAARTRKKREFSYEFRFWRQCNDRFRLMSNNPKLLNVRRLLKCYYELNDACNRTLETKLRDTFVDHLACCSETYLISWNARLNAELSTLVIGCDSGSSIDNYYKMVLYIILLNSPKIVVKNELIDKAVELLLRICRCRTQERRKRFHAFVCAAFHFLSVAGRIDTVDRIVQNILSCLTNEAPTNSQLWLTALCYFANVCRSRGNPKLQAAAKDIIVKLESTRIHSIIRIIYFNSQFDNCKKICLKRKNNNCGDCCESCCSIAVQPRKHLLLECRNENAKRFLQDILDMSVKVAQLSSQWDKEDIVTLKSIAHNISNAMLKK